MLGAPYCFSYPLIESSVIGQRVVGGRRVFVHDILKVLDLIYWLPNEGRHASAGYRCCDENSSN